MNMQNLQDYETFLNEKKNWIKGAIKKPGALKASLGMDKEEILTNAKINKELAKLKKKDEEPKKPGVQLGKADATKFKRLNLAKTLKKLSECNECEDEKEEVEESETIEQEETLEAKDEKEECTENEEE